MAKAKDGSNRGGKQGTEALKKKAREGTTKKPVLLTKQRKSDFLDYLRRGMSVSSAANAVGSTRFTVYDHRKKDEAFKEEWDDAVEEGVDRMEDEARRRAMEGVDEPVYYQGEEVGQVRKYSDTLLIFMLKGKRPSVYRDRQEIMGKDGEPLEIRVKYV